MNSTFLLEPGDNPYAFSILDAAQHLITATYFCSYYFSCNPTNRFSLGRSVDGRLCLDQSHTQHVHVHANLLQSYLQSQECLRFHLFQTARLYVSSNTD